MNFREAFTSRPWIVWPLLILILCVLANVALLIHHAGCNKLYERQGGVEREMTQIAESWRNIRKKMENRSDGVAPAGALDLNRIEELAGEYNVADGSNITTLPANIKGDLTERFVKLDLKRVRRQDLAKFLLAVENLDPAIRTRSLHILESRGSSGSDNKTLVDAEVQFSDYEKVSFSTE